MANNSNYFDFLKDFKNPLAGVTDSVTKDVSEGGLNLFGAEVPAEFQAYKNAGLLKDDEYKKAIDIADRKSKRSAIVQGLLGFGLQNFDKGFGSAFDPRYLRAGLAAALPAAQKPFDKLSSNFMNLEKLKEFKRTRTEDELGRKVLSEGIYKKETDKNGIINIVENTELVNKLIKNNKLADASVINNIFDSRRKTLEASGMSKTHTKKFEGDRIFYVPNNPLTHPLMELNAQNVLINSSYDAYSDVVFPDARKLAPVIAAIEARFPDMEGNSATNVALDAMTRAESWKKSTAGQKSDLSMMDYMDKYILENYDVSEKGWGKKVVEEIGIKTKSEYLPRIGLPKNPHKPKTGAERDAIPKDDWYINKYDKLIQRK